MIKYFFGKRKKLSRNAPKVVCIWQSLVFLTGYDNADEIFGFRWDNSCIFKWL